MPQLARRSAGDGVLDLTERLSDDLLVEEHAAFIQIEVPFAARAEYIGRLTVAAIDKIGIPNMPTARRWRTLVMEEAAGCRAEAGPALAGLLERSADLALDSVDAQLRLCEETVSKKYAHITDEAIRFAEDQRDAVMQQARIAFAAAEVQAGLQFATDLDEQVQMATLFDVDNPDRLAARMVHVEPLRAVGLSGRGVWWRQVATLQRHAREVSIAMVNLIIEAAMTGFNEAGNRR